MIQARGVAISLGPEGSIKDLSLSLHDSELYALLGSRDDGLSNVLELLSGQLRPDRGQVLLAGVELDLDDPDTRALLGWVPSELALHLDSTPASALLLFGRLWGLGGQLAEQRSEALLMQLGLSKQADTPLAQLGLGERKLTSIAAALMHQPKVLLLDQPTAGLDPGSAEKVLVLLRQLAQQGLSVMYASKDFDAAEQVADRVGLLADGELLLEGTPEQLREVSAESEIVVLRGRYQHERAAGAVAELDGVALLGARHDRLLFSVRDSELRLRGLLQATAAIGELSELGLRQPGLATLYLKLTGREP